MLHIKPTISALWRSKSGPVLLLLQIILSVAIVANASFIIHERLQLMSRDSGIAEQEVLTVHLHNFDPNTERKKLFFSDLATLKALPEVQKATFATMLPMSGSGWSTGFSHKPETDVSQHQKMVSSSIYFANEDFVDTLGLTMVEGRNFYPDEIDYEGRATDIKAIVSKAFAKEMWGNESPIGKVFYSGPNGGTVIGVVERLQGDGVNNDNFQNSVVLNYNFLNRAPNSIYLVRANSESHAELKDQIKTALLKENPYRVFQQFETISDTRENAYRNHAMMATVLAVMIALLLLIASLGLSGMVMFNIQKRTKQIGTRRALGARKRDIIQQFLVENYLICGLGGLLGGILAMQLGNQLMRHYDLPMLDISYALVTVAGLFVVTTIAVLLPARKAAAISPATATRSV